MASPHGMLAAAMKAPLKVLSSCATSSAWLARSSRPPSPVWRCRSATPWCTVRHCSTKACALRRERHRERLGERGGGGMRAVAEREAHGEFHVRAGIDAPGDGDVAVERLGKAPVHAVVVAQVLPAVARPDVAAGSLQEARAHAECQPRARAPRHQHVLSRGLLAARGVAAAGDLDVRGEQHVDLQALAPGCLGLDAGADQHAGADRVGDDLLHDPVAAGGVARRPRGSRASPRRAR